jgi:hypothetical protein
MALVSLLKSVSAINQSKSEKFDTMTTDGQTINQSPDALDPRNFFSFVGISIHLRRMLLYRFFIVHQSNSNKDT